MCGIAGYIHLDGRPAEPRVIARMTAAIAHRGPDGFDHWVEGPVALGHRRLAIIDLSAAAKQPMISGDDKRVITYNGELYNFPDVKAQLAVGGQKFRSKSDTEAVVEALGAWGTEALKRFNGMFAFAVWDRASRKLTLARDRFGVKPLYVARVGDTVLFGSEIKAIFASGLVEPEIDLEGFAEYLTFQNFFARRTMFKNVELMPQGASLEIDFATRTVREHKYWDYDFRDADSRPEDVLISELVERFRTAVSRQLLSDVEVGAYLSGGMDSGSIVSVARSQLDSMKTFTCGFDTTGASELESVMDERAAAEQMSYLFQTEQYEAVLKSGDMERCFSDLVWHLEEPRVGQSYPNYYAASLASRFVKVVLSGAGGDELFGGYPWRYYRAAAAKDFREFSDSYYGFWQRLLNEREMPEVAAPIWRQISHVDTRQIFRDCFSADMQQPKSPADFVNLSFYLEAKTFMHGLLVVEDKLSMAHGLEARVPFLDNDLVDMAMSIPVKWKIMNLGKSVRMDENMNAKRDRFYDLTRDGKRILRKAMSSLLPPEIAGGVKRGFSAPDATWFRANSHTYLRDRILTPKARIYDYLDYGAVKQLIDQHMGGGANRRLLIWSLLYLEEMMATFLTARWKDRVDAEVEISEAECAFS